MKKALATAFVVVAVVAAPAGATHGHDYASDSEISRRDARNDVSNKLDIVSVGFSGHGDGTATLSLRTDKAWGCGYISGNTVSDGGGASLRWVVNTNRDPYTERDAYISCGDGEWRLHWSHERVFEADRPDRRTVSVRLPLRKLNLDERKHLSFQAASFANGRFGDHVYVEESDFSPQLKPLSRR